MSYQAFLPYVLVMAVTTYLTRAVPLILFRHSIKSRLIRSFLYYMPYAVLSAMAVPGILYATGDMRAAAAGLLVALVLSWREKSLLTVAVCASAATLLVQLLL